MFSTSYVSQKIERKTVEVILKQNDNFNTTQ